MRKLALAAGVLTAVMAVLALAPALAQATLSSSTITGWTSSETGTPVNAAYLVSYDNPGHATSLTVRGSASGTGSVDIVCYFGDATNGNFGDAVFASGVAVTGGAFAITDPLRAIAGHACRLRAIPTGAEGTGTDVSTWAGPQVAVSQAGLPSGTVNNLPYDFYVIGTTFTGYAGWGSAGSCGPYAAPYDPSYGVGNFAIDCMGSLLGSANLPVGNRSEVEVDGHSAYDAASAQALFGGTEDQTQNDFPSLSTHALSDPTDGLANSQSTEGWVVCRSANPYPPNSTNCPTFSPAGVQLQRNISTSDGGLVVTMTDTWSSTDREPHSLDLLYDDYVGLKTSNAQRGYEFPGQSTFSAYIAGATVPGPSASPGSILVRTNLAAPDGDPAEAAGAITFSTPPSGYTFVSNSEFEEHQALEVPAVGSTSLTYIYSTDYTVAQVQALAQAAQDSVQAPAITISSPASGSAVSAPTVELTGTATAGSGISSLSVAGQPVPVTAGVWRAEVPLSPGYNTITVQGTDGAGATVQSEVAVVYQPPSATSPAPAPVSVCKVPRIKGMKMPAAEKALRLAHCEVGRIKHERSKKVRKDRVLSTSPPDGRVFPAGHRIELFLSKGP